MGVSKTEELQNYMGPICTGRACRPSCCILSMASLLVNVDLEVRLNYFFFLFKTVITVMTGATIALAGCCSHS